MKMTIYVDEIRKHPETLLRFKNWCHMMTDQNDLAELHDMAEKIGHKPGWFQPDPIHPHYDMVPSRRALAIKFGAIPVSAKKIIELCSFNRA